MPNKTNPNEFEPVQSDARLASLEQMMKEISSTLSTMQSGFTQLAAFTESDSFKKILNVIDIGADEAAMADKTSETQNLTSSRINLQANASTAVSGMIDHIEERSGYRTENARATASDDRFWANVNKLEYYKGTVSKKKYKKMCKRLAQNG